MKRSSDYGNEYDFVYESNQRYDMFKHKKKPDIYIGTIVLSMLEYKWTCRQAAREFGISKSAISQRIERDLKFWEPDLYNQIKRNFKLAKKHTSSWRRYI